MGKSNEVDVLYKQIIKEGVHLAESKETDGTYRGALLDDETNKIVGQAEFVKIFRSNDDEDDENIEADANNVAILIGAGILIFIAGCIAAPHISKWWNDKAMPKVKRIWCKITGKKEILLNEENDDLSVGNPEKNTMIMLTPDKFVEEVNTALEEINKDSSSEKAIQEFVEIFNLAIILSRKIRNYSKTYKNDKKDVTDNLHEWQSVMDKLSTQKVTDNINIILENNAHLVDENIMKSLANIIDENSIKDGKLKSIKNEDIKEALKLVA